MGLKVLLMSSIAPKVIASVQRGDVQWTYVLHELLPKHPNVHVGARENDAPIAFISFGMNDHTLFFGNAWSELAAQHKVPSGGCAQARAQAQTPRNAPGVNLFWVLLIASEPHLPL
jgi:hypothetical protein